MQKTMKFFSDNGYYFKKILIALITLFSSVIIIFLILRLIPGNVVHEYAISLAQKRGISYQDAYRLAVQLLNFDPSETVFQQFIRYITGLFSGNLGQSLYVDDVNVNLLIKQRLPWTLLITSLALMISFITGTAMGSFMARKRKSKRTAAMNSYIVVAGSMPDYLVGLILVLIFAYQLKIFPAQGNYNIIDVTPGFNISFILNILYHAFLPVLAFVIVQTGGWALLMRGNAIGVLGDDYVKAAQARGISEKNIRSKYLKKNAMLPLVTSLALTFGALFGGSTLMETIFNYPGLGMELASRIGMKDYFVVQGLMFFTSAIIIFINLITDLLYPLIDPRVKKGES
ncbi:ABC transporter permease [Acholeplasma laidlawii]|uniref:ABC transporter permease n=1 Tax=Acholeplasma laidlawii TaxID=2148 RepID=UPI0021F75C07|nr:ABC transporter permease [Acholeplasma laidlawii]